MFCLCLRQSGLWILDVALPVGSALKDDGKVGEYAFEGESRKVDCRVARATPSLLAMTLAERILLMVLKARNFASEPCEPTETHECTK
jgi:hypothetical protein